VQQTTFVGFRINLYIGLALYQIVFWVADNLVWRQGRIRTFKFVDEFQLLAALSFIISKQFFAGNAFDQATVPIKLLGDGRIRSLHGLLTFPVLSLIWFSI
jgi:hypothetical protein